MLKITDMTPELVVPATVVYYGEDSTRPIRANWKARFRRMDYEEQQDHAESVRVHTGRMREILARYEGLGDVRLSEEDQEAFQESSRVLEDLKEIAISHFVGWSGIAGDDGQPLEVTVENRSLILNSVEFRKSIVDAWKTAINPEDTRRKN